MTAPNASWSIDAITPEARVAAEAAAAAAGMPLEAWLNQLIKYVSTMELKARAATQPGDMESGEPDDKAAANRARSARAQSSDSFGAPPLAGGLPRPRGPGGPPATLPLAVLRPTEIVADEAPRERDIEAALENWRRTGVLEPVLVRPVYAAGATPDDAPEAYEIVTGLDRWQAARRLQMRDIPVIVEDMSDAQVIQAMLVRHVKRQTLGPLEEARAYRRLMTDVSMNTEELARAVGKPPSHVATMLHLLDLPEAVHKMIDSEQLTIMHARALLGARDPEATAREIILRRLDIYQTEQLVRATTTNAPQRRAAQNDNVSSAVSLERELSARLGLKVTITERDDIGVVSIHFVRREQLNDVVARLSGPESE